METSPFIDLLFKSMDWFLYYIDLRHERVKHVIVCLFKIFVGCFYNVA